MVTFEGVVVMDVEDVLFPGLPLFLPAPASVVTPLFALGLLVVPLDDNTIFNGGTFSPLPVDTPEVASDAFPVSPDDLFDTLEDVSLSSFSLSE